MNIIRVKHSSLRKSPTFWDADLVRKSRAFVKEKLFGISNVA